MLEAVTVQSQHCDHRLRNTSRSGKIPWKAQLCQVKDRYNSQDLTGESVAKNKQQRVIFLKLGFGTKIRKVNFHSPQKLPPLGLACPELPTFFAPGILMAR